jgi:hypothetical protein
MGRAVSESPTSTAQPASTYTCSRKYIYMHPHSINPLLSKALLRLYTGPMKALFRLNSGSMKGVRREELARA